MAIKLWGVRSLSADVRFLFVHLRALLPGYITTSKKDRAELGLRRGVNRNQVLVAYLLLIITVVLVTVTAVKRLHRVTIIGWHIRAGARVDNMMTKEVLRCLGNEDVYSRLWLCCGS